LEASGYGVILISATVGGAAGFASSRKGLQVMSVENIPMSRAEKVLGMALKVVQIIATIVSMFHTH